MIVTYSIFLRVRKIVQEFPSTPTTLSLKSVVQAPSLKEKNKLQVTINEELCF